ncbi:hypothetical protein [Metabacillus sp. Hm71]|uniref:hypothetical protein n=1 Tax=Metabacillus sp. Hm71 TaxID=3450743 RepID=UPI003F430D6D
MKNNITKAHEILNGSTGRYRELLDKMEKEIKKVKDDKKFSDHGKDVIIREIKKDFEEDLMKLSQQIKKEYQGELSKAKAVAEKALDNPTKKPDEKAIAKYRQQVEELKTKVMLSLKPDSAKGLVEDFVKGINDPYFANEFRTEFASVITPILSNVGGPEAAQIKHALSGTYEKLSDGFLTDEQREAKEVIESVDHMMGSRVFNFSVIDSVNGAFGRSISEQVNDPDSYFEAKEKSEE